MCARLRTKVVLCGWELLVTIVHVHFITTCQHAWSNFTCALDSNMLGMYSFFKVVLIMPPHICVGFLWRTFNRNFLFLVWNMVHICWCTLDSEIFWWNLYWHANVLLFNFCFDTRPFKYIHYKSLDKWFLMLNNKFELNL